VLLVLADSLAFHGPERAEPVDDPRLWPNVAAAALGGRAELVAGYGWTARHAWYALTRDPRVWPAMPTVDALVLEVGGMDTLPSPVPTALRELIPILRPDWLRRAVRTGYVGSLPTLSRALGRLPGGGPVALPPALTVRYLESCRTAVLAIRPGIPVVLMLPGVHRAAAYGYAHPGRDAAMRASRAWAAREARIPGGRRCDRRPHPVRCRQPGRHPLRLAGPPRRRDGARRIVGRCPPRCRALGPALGPA
jgi:hypothetical protein